MRVPAHAGRLPPILRQAAGRCACGGIVGPDGECAACRRRRLAAERGPSETVAPDAVVSRPGDAIERDADRIAAAVAERRTDPPQVGATGPVPLLMRSAQPAAPRPVPSAVAGAVRDAGPGQPLEHGLRSRMEAALGTSLSAVRVHTGPSAAASSRALDARAYTVGDHVVFGSGAYAPDSISGHRLLAHELAHVVQSRSAGSAPAIFRQACGHDGRPAECGAGGTGLWRLVDVASDAVINFALDDQIVRRMQGLFGGIWVTQVSSPPNPYKFGRDRGRIDGLKVTPGSALHLEVVEVKSRATENNGGCALASQEARGYVQVLRRIAPRVVEISKALSPGAGVPAVPTRAGVVRALRAAGIDPTDPLTVQALTFYRSLQGQLASQHGATLPAPLSSMDAVVNTDGTPNAAYEVITVLVDCTKRGKPGVKTRELVFQVNKAGGVSYGCENGECRQEEEERQRQAQQESQTGAQPSAQPGAQSRAQGDEQKTADRPGDAPRTPAHDPKHTPAHDPTIPIVVGVGTASGAGLALARARARRIAARKAAELAAKKALQAAWRREAEEAAARRLARQGAGKAAGKAVAYVEVAAAAALIIFYSDRAEARVGPGESPVESLYKAMTASGHPPSKELRALIESDPVLKELAEHAGQSGDGSALQEEATRRIMELVRDNPGEFSPDDLEMLAKFTQTAGAHGTGPKTVQELRNAIEAARQGKPAGSGAPTRTGTPGAGTRTGSVPTPGAHRSATTPSTPAPSRAGAGAPGTPAPTGDLPNLSPAARSTLPASGSPARNLFDAMVGQAGTGVSVTDEAVRRFLVTVPADLSPGEAAELIRQLRPHASETLDEVMQRLGAAVASLRTRRHGEPPRAGVKGQPAAPGTLAHPAHPAGRTRRDAPAGGASSAGHGKQFTEDDYVEMALRAINSFGAWEQLPLGVLRFHAAGDKDWRTAPVKSVLQGWAYRRVETDAGIVRAAAFVTLVIVSRQHGQVTVRVTTAGSLVSEDRTRQAVIKVGQEMPLTAPE